MKGNLTLDVKELRNLREAVIASYCTSKRVPPDKALKGFNSNLKNYVPLIEDIQKHVGYIGSKPLAVLLHFSKYGDIQPYAFRKSIVDTLTKYAYGISADDFLAREQAQVDRASAQALANIVGYWECYYDKDGTFQEMLKRTGQAQISVLALTIRMTNSGQAEAKFYHPKSVGVGSFEIQGGNIILHLRNERNLEPTFMIMNCGRAIDDFLDHVPFLVGYFLHINRFANPKAAKCLMIYDEQKKDVDFADPQFREAFRNKRILKMENDKVALNRIKDFFASGLNTLTMNVNDFIGKEDKYKNDTSSK
ncbi:MAG: hypothetical protein JWO03_3426 [Bacteroidetes bacterium]|nr:hypothetical protein [Bacteroidota bacterium]